jgi:hypothetical protein
MFVYGRREIKSRKVSLGESASALQRKRPVRGQQAVALVGELPGSVRARRQPPGSGCFDLLHDFRIKADPSALLGAEYLFDEEAGGRVEPVAVGPLGDRENLVGSFEAQLAGEQTQVVLVLADAVRQNLQGEQGLG